MNMQAVRLRVLTLMAGLALSAFSGWASADPPSRVARLGYTTGAVSFSPAGEEDWVQAAVNRPLTSGDRLWADAGARAEIQVGGAMIRMGAATGVSVLNLDDSIAQLQLTQGTLNVRVRSLGPSQSFEVDTPNLAFTLRQPGEYRIDVDADGNATTIVVRQGQGEAYGEGASYVIDSRQPYRFTGTGLGQYDTVEPPRLDDFDRWAGERDRAYDNSGSARYVSPDVVGYQDLDANGTWRADPTYGNVWTPNRVAAGWAPYRDGHWAWVDPWGWTWVDDAPWGFAVSHYGRWANFDGRWGWVPGPARTPAYYAPALVVFVGGANFQLAISSGNVGGVGWFPLAPREVYRPSYPVSRGYFENVNRSNTVVNNTVINNFYTNTNVTNVVYANRQVPGAVVAVPTTAFVQSQPVSRAAVQVTRAMVASAPVALIPQVAPTERSVRGAAAARDKPPPRVFERPVVARTAPPAAAIGFAAQQAQLAAKPGKPLDDAARKDLRPSAAAPAPAPVVKVVAPARAAAPTARPPAVAPAGKADDGRAKPDDRKAPAPPVAPTVPGAPPQRALPPQATPPVPVTPATEQRGKAEPPGKPEQRGQPVAPPQTPPARTAQPQVAPAQTTPAAPAARPAQPPGRPEPGGSAEPRGQAATPPPAPLRTPETKAAAPQVTPPAAQPAESRGKPEQRGQPVAPSPAPTPRAHEPQAATPQTTPPTPHAPEPKALTPQAAPPAPPQRAAEPKAATPQVAPPVPVRQEPPQRQAPPHAPPPPPAAPPAPAAPPPAQRAKPEPAPAAGQAEPHPPAPVAKAPPPQAQPAPQAQPRGQEKPAAGKPGDDRKDVAEKP